MRRKRKLIKRTLLEKLHTLYNQGVPITRIIRDYNLNISNPALFKLIQWNDDITNSSYSFDAEQRIEASLYPDWAQYADITEATIKYKGLFPLGEWVE